MHRLGMSGSVFQAGRDLLGEILRHGDVSAGRLNGFIRALRASSFRDVPLLKKIARRATRLRELKAQVEGLPDSLDAREERLVDAHSAMSEWLAHQFEIFEERARRYCGTSTQPSASMHIR